jgi:uncharacterized protein YcgL (UPF0745 family)
MDADIYKALQPPAPGERLYVLVPSGTDIKKLPDDIIIKTGDLLFFRKVSLTPGKQRIALDQDEAVRNLRNRGYHLQGAKIIS